MEISSLSNSAWLQHGITPSGTVLALKQKVSPAKNT